MTTRSRVFLKDVYDGKLKLPDNIRTLYELLGERTQYQAISHKAMPSFAEHGKFVRRRPYKAWYLIENQNSDCVGAIYLSKNNEIGLFIFSRHQGCGYGRKALKKLINLHIEDKYYANINPDNKKSIDFFLDQGFFFVDRIKGVQNTYCLTLRNIFVSVTAAAVVEDENQTT